MTIEIRNGASVNRFYSDGSGELLAVFQYTQDADRWAADYVTSMDRGIKCSLYRTCLYSGKSKVFHPDSNGTPGVSKGPDDGN